MKVTDDVAERVLDILIAKEKVWGVMVHDIRDAMNAALADLPDQSKRIAELEMELQTRPAASEGLTELVRRLTHAQQKLERIRMWRSKQDDGVETLPCEPPDYDSLDDILEEP